MTSEFYILDDSVLLRQPLVVYRLARSKYANLSGVGASRYPGRWNDRGQEAIYTSLEQGVPVLERLAHTPKSLIPSNLAMMEIHIRGIWEHLGYGLADVRTGAFILVHPSLSHANYRFKHTELKFNDQPPFAVAVPSVIVPVWNVVLYPQIPAFWSHVFLKRVEPFEFDPRLFPSATPVEVE